MLAHGVSRGFHFGVSLESICRSADLPAFARTTSRELRRGALSAFVRRHSGKLRRDLAEALAEAGSAKGAEAAGPLDMAGLKACTTPEGADHEGRTCRLSACSSSTESLSLSISETADEVVVHHADRLHVRIHDGRTDEAESAPLEILAERVGFG